MRVDDKTLSPGTKPGYMPVCLCSHGFIEHIATYIASLDMTGQSWLLVTAVLTLIVAMQKPKAAGEKKPKTTKPKVSSQTH